MMLTKEFWDKVGGYDLYVSTLVLDEIRQAPDKALRDTLSALLAAGYRKNLEGPVVVRFKGDGKLFLDIDLMLIDPGTLQKILKQSQASTIAGHFFQVVSLEHLIAMKFHAIKNDPESREPKDLLDIIQLVQRNGMDSGGPELRKICEAYGTPELFKKIQALTKGTL